MTASFGPLALNSDQMLLRPACTPHTTEHVGAHTAKAAGNCRTCFMRSQIKQREACHSHRQQHLPLQQLQHHTHCSVVARAIQCSSVDHGTNSITHDDVPSTSGREEQQQQPLTFEEVQQIAAARGLHISLKTLGPGYRIVCRDGGEKGAILGATDGFVAPLFGLMHCDTLQVFTRGMKGDAGDRIRKNPLGLGLLLGGAVFSYGRSCGCKKAEILAINDDDAWHERLVRYYSYFGFKPVCKVGGNGFFADVPHLLVWGGEGTRMDAAIDETLERWTPALRQSARSAARRTAAAAAAAAAAADQSSMQHSESSSDGASSSGSGGSGSSSSSSSNWSNGGNSREREQRSAGL